MLEKYKMTSFKSLRAILLLEANFNTKIISNDRLIHLLELYMYICIMKEKTQAAMYLILDKKLVVYIISIRKLLTATIYLDTTNYYSKVVYSLVSLYS